MSTRLSTSWIVSRTRSGRLLTGGRAYAASKWRWRRWNRSSKGSASRSARLSPYERRPPLGERFRNHTRARRLERYSKEEPFAVRREALDRLHDFGGGRQPAPNLLARLNR